MQIIQIHSITGIQVSIDYCKLRFRSTSSWTMKVRSWQLCLLLLMMAFNGHDSAKSVYDSFEPKTAANETGTILFSSMFFIISYTIISNFKQINWFSYIISSYDLRLLDWSVVLTKIFKELGSISDEISQILKGQNRTSSKLDKVLDRLDLDNNETDTGKGNLN